MTDAELAVLEKKLRLKFPAQYVQLMRRCEQALADVPPPWSEKPDMSLLTDAGVLLELNLAARKSPKKFASDEPEISKKWPDHLFICGMWNSDYLVFDTRQKKPKLFGIVMNETLEPSPLRDLTILEVGFKNHIERMKKEAAFAARPAAHVVAAPNLLAIGKAMAQPAVCLVPKGKDYAAVWEGEGVVPAPKGKWRHRISVACSALPVNPRKLKGVISAYEGTDDLVATVRHDASAKLPAKTDGIKLFAGKRFDCLPFLDIVFAKGPPPVQKWLQSLNWPATKPYDRSFMDKDQPNAYMRAWFDNHPFHSGPSGFVMLGGWMAPIREGECADWLDKTLLLLTLEGGEPYLEVWETGKKLEGFART